MKEASPVRAARAVVLCATLLLVAGSCGAANGLGGVRLEAPPELPDRAEAADVEQASEATAAVMVDTLYRAPFRRALATANLLASSLLMVGAVLLLSRRPSALWWVTQATIANALFSAADGASKVSQLLRDQERLIRVFDREIVVRLAAEGTTREELPLEGGHYLALLLVGMGAYAVVWIGIYLWIGWRMRRPDVVAVLRARDSS